jgi:type VI secretion system protein ImpK
MTIAATNKGNWLVAIYSNLLILGATLRTAADCGDAEKLRLRLVDMFQEAEREGERLDISRENLREARYAVAAYLDEMIMNSSWSEKEQWASRPLQYEFFNTQVAGVEFFHRIEALRRALPLNTDLLEIYYLCLTLGFEGKYTIVGREKRKLLIDEIAREIQAKRGERSVLSPHGHRPEENINVLKRDLLPWIAAGVSLAVVLLFKLVLSSQMSSFAEDTLQGLLQTRPQADRSVETR